MNQQQHSTEQTTSRKSPRMPALFIGHGSPMNAVEDNQYSRSWEKLGQILPKPKAILCISAHWETPGTLVTAMQRPRTIHDFYGFPPALSNLNYPAPGSPVLAEHISNMLADFNIKLDFAWGLDHGCWSILCRMYPKADIPILQLSLDRSKNSAGHYALGQSLQPLREQGILLIGSGNVVHNLARIDWQPEAAHSWASTFENRIRRLILARDHQALIDYQQLPDAELAVPTQEHFLPLLYILGAQDRDESIRVFNDKVVLGAISMLSLQCS